MPILKKTYIAITMLLVLIILIQGFVIYCQYAFIKREKDMYTIDEGAYERHLTEELALERRGLRHDDRGGDYCPACDSKSVAIIRYGYWTSGMWEDEIKNKQVVLGGCVVSEYSKRFYCNECGYKWGSLDSCAYYREQL